MVGLTGPQKGSYPGLFRRERSFRDLLFGADAATNFPGSIVCLR